MAKTRRRRPPNRTKSRPPTRAAAPRLGQTAPQQTERMYVGPSRRAKRAQYTRMAALGGAALGLLVAVVLIAGGSGSTSLPVRPVTAKVLSTTVQAKSSPDGTLHPLSDGDTVKEKAVIQTDAAGLGEFSYADGSVMRVGPSTQLSLTRARTNGSRREIANRLVTGKAWHHVAHKSGSNKYDASVLGADGQVKGTSFAVECQVENDCFYTLVKGKLHVKDAVDHSADLKDGDQVEVKFGRLEPVTHLSDADLNADPWIAQNIALDGGTSPPPTQETTTTGGDTTTTLPGDTTTTLAGGQPQTGTTIAGGGPVTTRPSSGGGPQPTQGTTATTHATTPTTAPPPSTTSPPTTAPPTTATTVCTTNPTTHQRHCH